LEVQIRTAACGVVKIPVSVKVVNLRCPNIAASRAIAVGVNDFGLGGLKAINCLSTRDLEVCPLGRHKIIITSGPGDLGIGAARVPDGVGEGRRNAEEAANAYGECGNAVKKHNGRKK
jgi:hypothetical protein